LFDKFADSIGAKTSAVIGDSLFGKFDSAGKLDWMPVSLLADETNGTDSETQAAAVSGGAASSLHNGASFEIADNGQASGAHFLRLTSTACLADVDHPAAGGELNSAVLHNSSILSNATLPVYTINQIADQLANAYWTFVRATPHHFNVAPGGNLTVNLTALTAEGQFFARAALQAWSETTGIHFNEVTAAAAISFDDNKSGAFEADTYANGFTLSANVNISTAWIAADLGNLNSYSYQTYLHEIGHALGLGHAGNYNGTATYGVDNHYLNDSWQASVMSYFSQDQNTYVNADFAYVMTPMMADIGTIQSLYGYVATTRADNTTYGFNSNAGNVVYDAALFSGVSYTIFDSGGVDTLDYSGFSVAQRISLEEESYSDIGGLVGNVGIANFTRIENAIGGAGADVLIGNSFVNRLTGNGGNDTYVVQTASDVVIEAAGGGTDRVDTFWHYVLAAGQEIETLAVSADIPFFMAAINLTGNELANTLLGSAGANVLNGGLGADMMYGYSGSDSYYVDNVLDKVFEAAFTGSETETDRVYASVSYILAAGQEIEILTTTNTAGLGAINLTGNAFNQTIHGNADANVLNGGGGIDTMSGFGGNDQYYVDAAGDIVTEAAGSGSDRVFAAVSYTLGAGQEIEILTTTNTAGFGVINLTGNAFSQTMHGNGGANILNGGGGADTLAGFGGNDHYYVDAAGDVVTEAGGGGSDRVFASASYVLTAGQEIEILTTTNTAGLGAIDLTGNAFNQTMHGNGGANVLNGGAGNDVISGFGGADIFVFNTALNAAANHDTITDFNVPADTIHLENAVFTLLTTAGALAADLFRDLSLGAQDADDVIIYNRTAGDLFYDSNGLMAGGQTLFADVTNGLALTALDFFVI
jgi:serralysin